MQSNNNRMDEVESNEGKMLPDSGDTEMIDAEPNGTTMGDIKIKTYDRPTTRPSNNSARKVFGSGDLMSKIESFGGESKLRDERDALFPANTNLKSCLWHAYMIDEDADTFGDLNRSISKCQSDLKRSVISARDANQAISRAGVEEMSRYARLREKNLEALMKSECYDTAYYKSGDVKEKCDRHAQLSASLTEKSLHEMPAEFWWNMGLLD